ncbi:hypothetical protein Tco_1111253 [Tanacetum coccineum]|uniref:Uncharacterized protein n=1 Tax=Tanacetum coccineum TaxID=301880 RepID=A0ABQ5IL33_9ASTR
MLKVNTTANDTKVSIPGVESPGCLKLKVLFCQNHDISRILPVESQRNITDPPVAITDSSITDYDSADESSICSNPLLPLEKLGGAELISGPKTIKSILKSNFKFKAEALKGIILNEPSSVPINGNNSASASKLTQPLLCKRTDYRTCDHAEFMIISLERELRNLQHVIKRCEASGSTFHTTTYHYVTEWFRRGKALQAKNAEAPKLKKTGSSNANRSKTPTRWWVSRQN